MMRWFIPLLLSIVTACSSGEAPLVATDVLINVPPPGMQMSAGYLTLRNNTREPITISRVSSPQFGSVEMHETVTRDGISRMVALDEILIPAGQSVQFEPGAKHLMLMRPAGELTTVSLEFYSGTDMLLAVDAAVAR